MQTVSVEEFRQLAGKATVPRRTAPHAKATPLQKLSELPYRISLPFLPPSVNKLFASVRTERGTMIRVLTGQARRLRKTICAMARGRLEPAQLYELHVDVYLPAYTRTGAIRRVDLSNRVKFLEDCLCAALGIDDRQFFKVVLIKHHAATAQTTVTITAYNEAA